MVSIGGIVDMMLEPLICNVFICSGVADQYNAESSTDTFALSNSKQLLAWVFRGNVLTLPISHP